MPDNKDKKNKNNKGKASKTPIETAYAYLGSRMRTAAETEKHLRDKGYSDTEIRRTIDELLELGYLDDYQFALRYYEYNREKRRGSLRGARELAAKGVDAETVRNAREDFLYENGVDEFADALAVASREFELKNPAAFDDRAAGSVARKLENRGFERDIIFRVLDRLRTEYSDGGNEL